MTVTSAQIFVLVAVTSVATFAISRHWERWRQMILSGIVAAFTISLFYMIAMMALSSPFLLPDFWAPLPESKSAAAPSGGVRWSVVPPNVARWEDEIVVAATECGVDPALLAALVNQESRGDEAICSKVGACGLTQLMPGTAKQMGVTDRSDPNQNLRGGACYLRQQLDRYGDTRVALAAYNAGPGNVDKYGGVPPFAETQKYVKLVPAFYEAYRAKGAGKQMAAFDDAAGEPVALVKNESRICCGWPVENVRITSQPTRNHTALDLGGYVGAPILAAHSGKVVTVATRTDYGRYVIIENGSIRTLYAHLESAKVKPGQQVRQGDTIGGMGATGNTRGVHLHFEIYQGGKIVNPLSFLP